MKTLPTIEFGLQVKNIQLKTTSSIRKKTIKSKQKPKNQLRFMLASTLFLNTSISLYTTHRFVKSVDILKPLAFVPACN